MSHPLRTTIPLPPRPPSWGAFGHAPFINAYGPSGAGKDADMVKAWPDAYLFGYVGSSDSWSTWGAAMAPRPEQDLGAFMTRRKRRLSIKTGISLLRAIQAGKLPWRPAIIVSDLSLLVDEDVRRLTDEIGPSWDLWAAVLDLSRQFRDLARSVDMVVAVNGHDMQQKEAPGHPDHIPGGLKLASHKARAEFHKLTDMNLHVVGVAPGTWGDLWERGYSAEPHPSWFRKDRWNKILGVQPLNLREALIAPPNGLWVPRRVGLEWLDDEANCVFERCAAGDPLDVVTDAEETRIRARCGDDPDLAYTAVYDGLCRYFYRTVRPSRFALARQRRAPSVDALFEDGPAVTPTTTPVDADVDLY